MSLSRSRSRSCSSSLVFMAACASCAAWASWASCAAPPDDIADNLGEACDESESCARVRILVDVNDPTQNTDVIGECVAVDDTAICLPAIEREPTACEDADDCVNDGFPIDALCGDEGLCLCIETECIGAFETFVAERCACFAINGESCQVDQECASRECVDDVCRAAAGEPCTFSQECASGECDVNDVCT